MRFKLAKYSLYGLKGIVFILLLIGSYFQYMKSALDDYFKNSLTVVTRSEEIKQYEAPAITVCANYDFKPSVQINNKFDFSTRYISLCFPAGGGSPLDPPTAFKLNINLNLCS